MYVYQDMSQFTELNWGENKAIKNEDFILPEGKEQIEIAKNFTYVEQLGYKDKNITPIVVKPNNVRVEGNAMVSCINNFIKLTDTQDFELPYGFEKKVLSRNIDIE